MRKDMTVISISVAKEKLDKIDAFLNAMGLNEPGGDMMGHRSRSFFLVSSALHRIEELEQQTGKKFTKRSARK